MKKRLFIELLAIVCIILLNVDYVMAQSISDVFNEKKAGAEKNEKQPDKAKIKAAITTALKDGKFSDAEITNLLNIAGSKKELFKNLLPAALNYYSKKGTIEKNEMADIVMLYKRSGSNKKLLASALEECSGMDLKNIMTILDKNNNIESSILEVVKKIKK